MRYDGLKNLSRIEPDEEVKRSYQVLEEWITRGFLTLGVTYLGFRFVFRTLNGREYQVLQNRVYGSDTVSSESHALAMSLVLVNGFDVDPSQYTDSYQIFESMDYKVRSEIIRNLMELRNYCLSSLKYIEGFSYTSRSEYLWDVYRGKDMYSDLIKGRDVAVVGFNEAMEQWVSLNNFLDAEKRSNEEMDRAVFIASASNSGVKDVRSSIESRRSNTDEERKGISIYGSRDIVNNEEIERLKEGWAAPPTTKAALLAEIEKIRTGYEDKHDLFVKEWADRNRKENTRKRQSEIDRIEREAKLRELEGGRPQGTLLMSKEQLEKHKSGMLSVSDLKKSGKVFIGRKSLGS